MENVEVQTKFTPLYNIANNQDQYYAPFMAKSKRFKQSKQKNQIPAIGTYNLHSCFQRKKSPFDDRMDRFLLQAQKKKQQMSMFKSSCNRFDKIYKQIPGPASYNLFKNSPEKQNFQIKKSLVNDKKIFDITKTCPSIPYKDNKYGYQVADGKYKKIQKGLDQLQLQKYSRKQYTQTLKGQKHLKRQSDSFSSSQNDFKKKLYELTQKIVPKENLSQSLSQKSINFAKKPKIQHLYHSKGVPVNVNHKLLGPGQYDIKSKDFDKNSQKQKFQFFGSSEVRFKLKLEAENKGYTLLQMLRQTKKLDRSEKKSPIRRNIAKPSEKTENKSIQYPGPGQYDPKDENKKIGRGNTFFPQSERFKLMYSEKRQDEESEATDQVNQLQKKNSHSGCLKKDRFKPMQKVYQPVKSSQIRGILSENKKVINKIQGLSKQTGFQNQEINSWSRQQKRNNLNKKHQL